MRTHTKLQRRLIIAGAMVVAGLFVAGSGPVNAAIGDVDAARDDLFGGMWWDASGEPSFNQEPPKPVPGRDLASCYDGYCQVTVVEGDSIYFADQFGISELRVTEIRPWQVTFEADYAKGGKGVATVSPGSSVMLNNLTIEVEEITGGEALVTISSS